jgi:hypothetical protein
MQVGGMIERLTQEYIHSTERVLILNRSEMTGEYTIHEVCAIGRTTINGETYLTINAETQAKDIALAVEFDETEVE